MVELIAAREEALRQKVLSALAEHPQLSAIESAVSVRSFSSGVDKIAIRVYNRGDSERARVVVTRPVNSSQ